MTITGLLGGHSGMEIHRGRTNAALLAGRILSELREKCDFRLLSLSSGTKLNAIPCEARLSLLTSDADGLCQEAEGILEEILKELSPREPALHFSLSRGEKREGACLTPASAKKLFEALSATPCGVVAMSPVIFDLVETSLNLGVLRDEGEHYALSYHLRSNVAASLEELKGEMASFAARFGGSARFEGSYPPWEYGEKSSIRDRYVALYRKTFGKELALMALHAGLECGTFTAAIPDLDVISIGPNLFDVHTTKEKMSLSSVERVYGLLLSLLAEKDV